MDSLHKIIDALTQITPWSVALRLMMAVLMGLCIGYDRERHGRAAGSRTHMLVCLAAAITTLLGFYTSAQGFGNDPLRMGSQVVSGIGFLGAGTILVRNHSHIVGLTTAAGLWATACLGLAVGAGFYWAALLSFGVIMITMIVFTRLEAVNRRRGHRTYYVEMGDVQQLKALYGRLADYVLDVQVVPARSGIANHMGLEVTTANAQSQETILTILSDCHDVVIAVPV